MERQSECYWLRSGEKMLMIAKRHRPFGSRIMQLHTRKCVCMVSVCTSCMICHGRRHLHPHTRTHGHTRTHRLIKGLNPVAAAAAPSTAAVVNIRSRFSTLFMAKATERGVKGSKEKRECTSLLQEKGGVTT